MTSVERSPRRLPSRTTAAYWILVAACVVVPTAPPSHAETTSRSDHLGDLRHALDLVSLRVTHGLKNVRVTLEHRNLKRMGAEGWFGFVYLDTYGGKRGPEFLFVGPMGSTTWSLYPVGDFYDEYEESLCQTLKAGPSSAEIRHVSASREVALTRPPGGCASQRTCPTVTYVGTAKTGSGSADHSPSGS